MINLKNPIGLLIAAGLLGGATHVTAQNITLPTPLFIETFDQVQEGSLPTGWTVQNFTVEQNAGLDLDDPKSDSYKDWVVISRDRVVAIGENGGWNASQRLEVKPDQLVNGQLVTNLITGNFAYAESDVRAGSQVQYLFSPDFNLSGKTDIYLSYRSIYTQNQDNIASVEYSIDGGVTWLPIIYMINAPDIAKDASGNTDPVATLSAPQGDTATYTDPVTGEDRGGFYGAFIGVSSNLWSTLAPFISARIDDDQVESKRVELFRLPQADNQASVRLRFAQAGTASWFFGIDDVGFYSIQQVQPPKITQSPASALVSAGSAATLKVVAEGQSLAYQWKFNGNNLAGQTNDTLVLSNITDANAGDYQVVVSNAGGETPSAVAKIEVFSGAVTQDLVVHLKFENNYSDTSGKGNNGEAAGAPSFSAGKIGSAVHLGADGDYVFLGAPADLNFSTNVDFSISMWAKLTEFAGDPSLISNKDWNSGGNQGYVIATDDDGHLQWNLAGPPGTRKDYDGPPGTFSDDAWHHVVLTFNRDGNATTYVDGQSVDSRPLTGNQNDVSTPDGFVTAIGQDGTTFYGSAFTNADFDDVGIWRRVLTVQEVMAIYNAGLAGKDLTQATISEPAIPPTFTVQPQSQSVTAGATVTLSATVAGSQPLTYQWKFNSADIAGATASSLVLTNVQPANSGAYTVVASNAGGSVTSAAANLVVNTPAPSVVTGQWDFDQGDLRATVGAPLEYRGSTAAGTTFTEMQIAGQPAKVMGFPAATAEQGYIMTHGAAANAGGTNVNQYTLIMDLMFPAESNSKWRGLLQTDPTNVSDGDLFINTSNGLGISGQYQGTVQAATWHRVAVVFDLTASMLKKYIDGNLVNVQTLGNGLDQRWSLLPTALLFTDEDGETSAGFVNSIQFRSGLMSDTEIQALGTPTAAGIAGGQTPTGPQFTSITRKTDGSITVEWTGGGTLQAAPSVLGPWQDVPGATSPYTLQPTGAALFGRIRQ